MAICNQLNVNFNYYAIDNEFDFYLIVTTEKYIPFGAKCLDFESGKIESGSLPQPSDMAPKARPNCETSRLSSQNVPFQDAKRAISQAKTAQMPSLCLTKFNTLVIYLIEI